MLYEFVAAHQHELIARCKLKVQKRFARTETPALVDHGVPLFQIKADEFRALT